MIKWVKKFFVEPPAPERKPTLMVEALQELWDVNQKKEIERPPPNVPTDIYAVANRDKAVPPRPRSRRQHYRKAS